MKQVNLIIMLVMITTLSFSQQAAKNVYLEIGGPGGFASANFDARISKSNKGLGLRAGVGILFDPYALGVAVPVGINYLAGAESHFLELGTGASFVHFKSKNQDSWFNFRKENFLVGAGWIGYRYQPINKGFTFRAGLCKFFGPINTGTILGVKYLYPMLSFGYSF